MCAEELLIKSRAALFISLTGDNKATRKRKKRRKKRRKQHERMKYVVAIRWRR